jgi:acyl carrier protein
MSEASPTADGRWEEEVRATIRSLIMELAPYPDETAGGDARLVDDLGFHSLALLELAFTLEDEFDLPPIDEETARRITTIASVEDHVVADLKARGEPADTT